MRTNSELLSLRRDLLDHFDAHRRLLPWRESDDPYHVWVSEIMLQQTRVETATPYFVRWMKRFPSVAVLAEAEEQDVLKAWEGLGYYSRARNLHRSARIVTESLHGVIPTDADGLRELPGIGEYSAGAIASIAFGQATPAVDGNARRVISRLFDLAEPSASELRKRATTILDADRPGDWNQAVMELGATVCLPRAPRCGVCPISSHCLARVEGTQGDRPMPKRRNRVRDASFAVLVIRRDDGELLFTRRRSEGLLGGLWEFPTLELARGEGLTEALARLAREWQVEPPEEGTDRRYLEPVRHAFSHIKAVYRPLLLTGEGTRSAGGRGVGAPGTAADASLDDHDGAWCWATPDRADELALPVAQRKILEQVVRASILAPTRPPGQPGGSPTTR